MSNSDTNAPQIVAAPPLKVFKNRRESDRVLLAHVQATWAGLDLPAKKRYINSLLSSECGLTEPEIVVMVGITPQEFRQLERDLD